MITTTTDSIDGKNVSDYCGIVSGEAIMGANLFKDFFAGIRDVIGGRSGAYEKEFRKAKEYALADMVEQAKEVIGRNRSIVIFPQGTRTVTGDTTRPYLPGVAGLYSKANVPVVPVALNSGMFWPRNKFIKYQGKITVEFLEPIPPGLSRKEFTRRLKEAIEPATARLEAEAKERFFN